MYKRAMQKKYQLYRTGFLRATMKRIELRQRSDDIRLLAVYWRPMVSQSSGRKYFGSHRGYLGVGLLGGMNTPLVLRSFGDDHYQIFGEAYVHVSVSLR